MSRIDKPGSGFPEGMLRSETMMTLPGVTNTALSYGKSHPLPSYAGGQGRLPGSDSMRGQCSGDRLGIVQATVVDRITLAVDIGVDLD